MYNEDPQEPMNAPRVTAAWYQTKRLQDARDYWSRIHHPNGYASGGGSAGPIHGGWPWLGVIIGSFLGVVCTKVTPDDSQYLIGAAQGAVAGWVLFFALGFVFRGIGMAFGLVFGAIGGFLGRLQGFPAAAKRGAYWGAGAGFVDNLYSHHDSLAAFGLSAVALGGMAGMGWHALNLIRGRLRGG